jgi:hypothetical protein
MIAAMRTLQFFFLRQAALACAATTVFVPSSFAASVVLDPSKDNTLYENASGLLSNGQGDFLFAGQTGPSDGMNFRRALIAFDLATAIPANALITSVTLALFANKTAGAAFNTTITLSRLTGDWGEGSSRAPSPEGAGGTALPGDATWLHQFFSNDLWTTPGGDFVTPASASTVISSSQVTYSWSSAGLVNDVQFWINNPAANFGWIVRGNETNSQTAVQFDSRSNLDVSRRPRLTVEYQVIPEPSSALSTLMSVAASAAFLRRRKL